MHRQALLGLLDGYGRRFPDERETVARFRDFVDRRPDCFERNLAEGHVTGSAWVVDTEGGRVLLTHHRKLDRWLQLGGHADGDPDVLRVALNEAREESGLPDFEPLGEGIFDLDIHPIPARGAEPAHLHYDVRFVLRALGGEPVVSEESHDVRWIDLDELTALTTEPSMLRMRAKWQAWRDEPAAATPAA